MTADVELTTFLDLLWGGDEGAVVVTFGFKQVRSQAYAWPSEAGALRRDVLLAAGLHLPVWVSSNLFKTWVVRRAQVAFESLDATDLLPRARTLLIEVAHEASDNGRGIPARDALMASGGALLSAGGRRGGLVVLSLDSPRPHALLTGWAAQVVRATGAKRWHSLHWRIPVPGSHQPDGLVRLDTKGPARRVSMEDLTVLRRQVQSGTRWSE